MLTHTRPLLADEVLVVSLDSGIDKDKRSLELFDVLISDDGNGSLEAVVAIGKRGASWLDACDALPLLVDLAPWLALLHRSQH